MLYDLYNEMAADTSVEKFVVVYLPWLCLLLYTRTKAIWLVYIYDLIKILVFVCDTFDLLYPDDSFNDF